MEAWRKHLLAASGYLELGMLDEAALEIEEIPPEEKMRREVLVMRLEIYRSAKAWDAMEAVANHLTCLEPEEPAWLVSKALAARRTQGILQARILLEEGLPRFPQHPLLHYNLACYLCQLGEQETAKRKLQRAFELDASLRLIALDDPDLEPLWSALDEKGGQ